MESWISFCLIGHSVLVPLRFTQEENIHRAIFLRILHFFFRSEIQFFRQKSAIWSSDSFERQFLVHSWKKKTAGQPRLESSWSMVYCQSSPVSEQIYHRSTSFPSKYNIEPMVYRLLPNLINVGLLWRISRGPWANQKRWNILNE